MARRSAPRAGGQPFFSGGGVMIRERVVVQAVRSRDPLRVRRLGVVELDRWHWPFKVGAHCVAYRFLCPGSRRVFHRSRLWGSGGDRARR